MDPVADYNGWKKHQLCLSQLPWDASLVVLKYTASPIPSLINHRWTPSTQVFSRACWGSTLGGESNQVLQEVRGAALAFLSRSVRMLCKPTAPLLLCNVSSVLSLQSKPRTTFPYSWETPTVCWRHLHWPRDYWLHFTVRKTPWHDLPAGREADHA